MYCARLYLAQLMSEAHLSYGPEAVPVSLNDLRSKVGPGWAQIVEGLVADLLRLGWNGKVLQIKQKFGELRFYIPEGTDAMSDRCQAAAQESLRTCERCGERCKGEFRSGFPTTLCDRCAHPDNRESQDGDSEEFRKFKAAMIKIVSVRKEDVVEHLPDMFRKSQKKPLS